MASWMFSGVVFVFLPLLFCHSYSFSFTIMNNCPYAIWPGTLAGSGMPQLPMTGFRLDSGKSVKIPAVPGWSGRIWARTGCSFDEYGVGTCQTGDCGGRLECDGKGATPPVSLFEITMGNGNEKDYYDISIVDGYNLPLVAAPRGVYSPCNATGCASDLNMGCPKELQVVGGEGSREGQVVACKSACDAFGLDQYCCSGEFANPTMCRPSFYSKLFKRACPKAYSYAYDDGSSTFTCKAYEYDIVFCPYAGRTKRPGDLLPAPPVKTSLEKVTEMVSSPPVETSFEKVTEMVSSSNILSPFPVMILLLIVNLFF
ncbi:hypothetical protein SLE2022_288340 [Rubroshorea leprosula]